MIDVAACERAGVTFIHAEPDGQAASRRGNAKATADLALGHVLCLAYRVAEADAYTRAGGFRQEMTMDLMGLGCTDKTVGVVGMGRVARELAPRLNALDMSVLYTKRSRLPPEEEAGLGVTWRASLEELLPECDYVVMLANYNASTHKLMGAAQFALMKPTAYFINPGRGRLVDEEALIRGPPGRRHRRRRARGLLGRAARRARAVRPARAAQDGQRGADTAQRRGDVGVPYPAGSRDRPRPRGAHQGQR